MWTKNNSETANFCSNTVFSLYLKLERSNFTPFLLHFLFRRDHNHYSNWTPKIMKRSEQNLKKHSKASRVEKLKVGKLKESKLNKNILIAETLWAFKPKANFFHKYVQNQFLFLKSAQYYICKTWKIIIGPWRSINSKINKRFRKKNQLQIIR